MDNADSAERRARERRRTERRGLLKRRAGPGRRIWIRRDSTDEVGEDNDKVLRGDERRSETARRGGKVRRADPRRKGDRRLD